MSEQSVPVEGQTLARSVLDALERGETPDWTALDRAYREPLLQTATARLRRLQKQHELTPEDVLHDFLQRRIYPASQARKMFTASANGERPLRPRLLTSLANHCSDMVRANPARRQRGEQTSILASIPAPVEIALPDYEEVVVLLRRQMDAIRDACPVRRGPHGGAYREALLLRLRLEWAGGFDRVALRSAMGRDVILDLPLLEELTPWTEEEKARPLVEDGISLEELWRQVRAALLETPDRQVPVEQLASLLSVRRDVWNQWISRGRRMVADRMARDFSEVFAMWSKRGGGA
jgi:hypothetical protein